MYIYTPLCIYWITLYRYVLVFIVPHVDIELEDNKQFISNIPRIEIFTTKKKKIFRYKKILKKILKKMPHRGSSNDYPQSMFLAK